MAKTHTLEYATAPASAPRGPLSIIFFIILLDVMGFGLIIPLLPFYAMKYQASAFEIGLLFSLYSACQFIAAPVLGQISDRYGRRPVLVFSQLGSVAGYLLLGFATQHPWANPRLGLWMVFLSRVIDGLSGGNISTAQAYISDVTTPQTRAKGMGLLGAAFGVGFAAGPALGGLLGHRYVALPAYVAAALCVAAALVTHLRLPESRRHIPASAEAWLHPRSFLPVLRRPVLGQLMFMAFVSMLAFVMMEAVIALFLADRFGYGQRQVGGFFAFMGAIIIVVQGAFIGQLTRRLGDWPWATLGPALVAIGFAGYVLAGDAHSLTLLLVAAAFGAVGRSMQYPTVSALVSKFSDARDQGTTFGLYQGLGGLARVLGPVMAGSLYDHWWKGGPFVVAAGLCAACAVWTGLLRVRSAGQERAAFLTAS